MSAEPKPSNAYLDVLLREWLVCAAAMGLAASSAYLRRLPALSADEFEVLLLLWALFVCARGLQRCGVLVRAAEALERGGRVPLKLIALTFVLAMVVTNDAALVVVVPLTLTLRHRRAGLLVVLEALAANAGAALTPVGSPQNLYIYWVYRVDPREFVLAIAPLSLAVVLVLLAVATWLRTPAAAPAGSAQRVERRAWVWGGLLVLVVLAVLRVVPLWVGGLVPAWALAGDRRALRVDYGLLLAFLCLFGLTDNLRLVFAARLEHPQHVFLLSALASQLMSNVPATLLFAEFTTHWKALLWGVNVGGFGSLVASFANLIAYRLYVRSRPAREIPAFTIRFLGLGYAMFALGLGLYWLVLGRPAG